MVARVGNLYGGGGTAESELRRVWTNEAYIALGLGLGFGQMRLILLIALGLLGFTTRVGFIGLKILQPEYQPISDGLGIFQPKRVSAH
uniref:Uncharacterized protein n=1 Tax=Cannabis sativa TaxID=3483 RepID=A0A803QI70_CANSA